MPGAPLAFSLLLPVYAGDVPAYLDRSLRSAVDDQHRPPDEVVVVLDGPVPPELHATLDAFRARCPVPVTLLPLQANVGLGAALEAGLAACRYEVVARQDADDISVPTRFAVQLPVIEAGADIVGSAMLEFGEAEHDVVGRRTPPTDPAAIARYARFHDPFNHPSVVYRKAAVAAAGGYQHLDLLEDYWLFARMIENGAAVANVPEPLVLYRVGAGAYARRGGWALLRSELELQQRLRREGFLTTGQYLRNVAVRGGYRLVPERLRTMAYKRVFTTQPS
jgi:glycosyltransferase involved in cell wall biosynthesis